jgi:hypothetical protein
MRGFAAGRFGGHAGGRARPCCCEMTERAAGEYPADSSSINVSLGGTQLDAADDASQR